jgi:hypothetical protein
MVATVHSMATTTVCNMVPKEFVNVKQFITLLPQRSEAEQDEAVIQKVEQRGRFFRVTLDDGSGRPKAEHWRQSSVKVAVERVGDWAHPLFTTRMPRKLSKHVGADVHDYAWDQALRLLPYEYVQFDASVEAGYRLIVYGAFNAGIIGSEHNGIALLDNRRKEVVADRVMCETSGWGGMSIRQSHMANRLARLMIEDRAGFAAVMNKLCAGRLRREVVA